MTIARSALAARIDQQRGFFRTPKDSGSAPSRHIDPFQDEGAGASKNKAARLFIILAAGAAGMAALLALLPAAGHDQLWFLLMARRWLDGAPLYGPQAFDSNPPAIVWFSAVPVRLGELCHLPATSLAKFLVALIGAGCARLSLAFLPQVWRPRRRFEGLALLCATIMLFGVVPARDFGQRDHLAALLLLPYVLAAGLSGVGPSLQLCRMAAGALAATAICLKPHYALVPLLVEPTLLFFPATFGSAAFLPSSARNTAQEEASARVREGSAAARLRHLLRPEPIMIAAFGALYLLAIRHFAPLYFSSALPLTRRVYWAIGDLSLRRLLWEAVELCVLACAACLFCVRQQNPSPAVRLLLLAGFASFAAYLLQGTGWYYQQLPAICFFGLALALELLDAWARRPVSIPRWLNSAAAGLVLLALALTTHFTGYPFTEDRAFAIESPDPALFHSLPPGTPVAILTTSVDEAMMPVARYHLQWAQRTNNLWLLPAVLRSERAEGRAARRHLSPDAVANLDALQHRWMVEDLTRWQPRLVLVERCQEQAVRCQVLEDRHDDLLTWFGRDPAFAALWRSYTFLRADGRFNVYSRK